MNTHTSQQNAANHNDRLRTKAWILQWWDAFGTPHQSAPITDRGQAETALTHMDIQQEAQLTLIYIN